MACAEMLQRALPRSHCSSAAADDTKTWLTPPPDQSIQGPVSTVQVVLCPGDRRQPCCHFLISPRQALAIGRKAQTAGKESLVTEAPSCEV